MSVNDWLHAFLLTQAIEIPIYGCLARNLPMAPRLTYAFGASAITHPFLWFCLPWATARYLPLCLAGETGVVLIEGAWGKLWRVPRPWRASITANLSSILLGSLLQWLFPP